MDLGRQAPDWYECEMRDWEIFFAMTMDAEDTDCTEQEDAIDG